MQEAQIILARNDYDILMLLLKSGKSHNTFNRNDAEELHKELKRAKLVASEDLPPDIVRLNSAVTIKDAQKGEIIKLTVVTPGKTNIKQKKISILSPIGTALIGFGVGQQISWMVPAGKRTFTILEVVNTALEKELPSESAL